MADAVSGASKAVAMRLFGPQPSITIVTFWQGIVEIVLRGVSVVSSVTARRPGTNWGVVNVLFAAWRRAVKVACCLFIIVTIQQCSGFTC